MDDKQLESETLVKRIASSVIEDDNLRFLTEGVCNALLADLKKKDAALHNFVMEWINIYGNKVIKYNEDEKNRISAAASKLKQTL